MLKIAVQKSDRISKGFLELLNKCGLNIDGNHSKLYCKFNELPIELYFVRGCDIPALLENKFDLAILGTDSFFEYNLHKTCQIKKELGFAKCRLSLAGKTNVNLQNSIIATSYVNILQNYLTEQNINAKIVQMNGSVESSIELSLANVIFDIVQTGSTLLQHGLTEFEKVLDLQAILITKNGFQNDVFDKLLFRINAVLNAKPSKYIMFNLKKDLLNNILNIMPAGKSPTILDLADKNYCAIHALCNENDIWDISEKLQKHGAEDIVVSDVNLRFL
ncbi:ATP phosphoribosyltransferase [Candidatus Deianiraea vastatrix]|uniref:ATP phosphoribosyltransferase n=1 Tax=Candidatus Deianiraea vastatrix TaxID=2163644 RepID=A0A5B8XEE0_9RICK|nr:ATP phosphoribosyltransferase [Candidatus Deianiraea vastatrix]QED23610.1 ATP phosphoribosyltransferase [Candidatus Deianiraea vastatrix]